MPPVVLMDLVVGPIAPATKRGRCGVENSSAAWRASSAARRFSSCVSLARFVLGQHDGRAAEAVRLDNIRTRRQVGAMDAH